MPATLSMLPICVPPHVAICVPTCFPHVFLYASIGSRRPPMCFPEVLAWSLVSAHVAQEANMDLHSTRSWFPPQLRRGHTVYAEAVEQAAAEQGDHYTAQAVGVRGKGV